MRLKWPRRDKILRIVVNERLFKFGWANVAEREKPGVEEEKVYDIQIIECFLG